MRRFHHGDDDGAIVLVNELDSDLQVLAAHHDETDGATKKQSEVVRVHPAILYYPRNRQALWFQQRASIVHLKHYTPAVSMLRENRARAS